MSDYPDYIRADKYRELEDRIRELEAENERLEGLVNGLTQRLTEAEIKIGFKDDRISLQGKRIRELMKALEGE